MAVPGFLLSGWAPARVPAQPVHIGVRDLSRPGAESLRRGVAFGVHEVGATARLTRSVVSFHHLGPEGHAPDAMVEVVVSAHDDMTMADAMDGITRIHTCPLQEWRCDAWSVASGPASDGRARDWHPMLARSGAAQLNTRFRQHAGMAMDEAAWRGWMAVKVAHQAAMRTLAGEADLLALEFDGHKGMPLRFGEDGHLRQPTFRVERNSRLVTVFPRLDLGDAFA